MDANKDEILDAMDDFDILDNIDHEGNSYFVMTPLEGKEDEGEVFIMKLREINGAQMLEAVDDDAEFDVIYQIFKDNNKDEFEFLD
ncbi:MAG: DUF1292 domain-containing protein [Clostridia bacterium]|nr:DUF1292 domain-containing protein [Clostridia bacterium]